MRSILTKVRAGCTDFKRCKYRTKLAENKLAHQLTVEKSMDKSDSRRAARLAQRKAAVAPVEVAPVEVVIAMEE